MRCWRWLSRRRVRPPARLRICHRRNRRSIHVAGTGGRHRCCGVDCGRGVLRHYRLRPDHRSGYERVSSAMCTFRAPLSWTDDFGVHGLHIAATPLWTSTHGHVSRRRRSYDRRDYAWSRVAVQTSYARARVSVTVAVMVPIMRMSYYDDSIVVVRRWHGRNITLRRMPHGWSGIPRRTIRIGFARTAPRPADRRNVSPAAVTIRCPSPGILRDPNVARARIPNPVP